MKDIELPPLPDLLEKAIIHFAQACLYSDAESRRASAEQLKSKVQSYARAAVEADRAQRVPEKYDDTLMPFLALMRRELHANSGKGDRPGWRRMSPEVALLEIYWHTAKLSAAVKNNDGPAIEEHSADVANMAMMLLDVCDGLTPVVEHAAAPAPAQQERKPMTDSFTTQEITDACIYAEISDGQFQSVLIALQDNRRHHGIKE